MSPKTFSFRHNDRLKTCRWAVHTTIAPVPAVGDSLKLDLPKSEGFSKINAREMTTYQSPGTRLEEAPDWRACRGGVDPAVALLHFGPMFSQFGCNRDAKRIQNAPTIYIAEPDNRP